jgi:hypothetical protein
MTPVAMSAAVPFKICSMFIKSRTTHLLIHSTSLPTTKGQLYSQDHTLEMAYPLVDHSGTSNRESVIRSTIKASRAVAIRAFKKRWNPKR